jgi:hypothetical protein
MVTRKSEVTMAEKMKLKKWTFITYYLVVQGPIKSFSFFRCLCCHPQSLAEHIKTIRQQFRSANVGLFEENERYCRPKESTPTSGGTRPTQQRDGDNDAARLQKTCGRRKGPDSGGSILCKMVPGEFPMIVDSSSCRKSNETAKTISPSVPMPLSLGSRRSKTFLCQREPFLSPWHLRDVVSVVTFSLTISRVFCFLRHARQWLPPFTAWQISCRIMSSL